MNPTRVIMCVDFEQYSQDQWCTAALLALEYPNLRVLEQVEVGCRNRAQLAPELQMFWSKFPAAKEYNDNLTTLFEDGEAERRLVEAFERVRSQSPLFMLIGDNLSFDIAHLDALLQKYGLPRSCFRPGNLYRQPVCTWSYKLGRPLFLKNNLKNTSTIHKVLLSLKTNYLQDGEKHTPLFDCFETVTMFIIYLHTNPVSKLTKVLQWPTSSVVHRDSVVKK